MKLFSIVVCPSLGLLLSLSAMAEESTSLVADGAKVKKLAGDMKFTEGPIWLPVEKKLVFSDIPNSQLMQWRETDGLSVFRSSDQANGNILDLQGRIISCQHGGRNVIRIENNGRATVLAERFEDKRFNSPNDVAVRSDGTLWFTDPPWGLWGTDKTAELPGHWVFKLHPDTGQVEAIVKDLSMPNGIVFSPDESRLYIADTGGNQRHPDVNFRELPASIQCYEVSEDGTLGSKRFHIEQGSDGMAVDVEGNIYTTHDSAVYIFSADGQTLEQIDVPEGPANVCFGDDDLRTLFITARTSLYSVRMRQPGAKPKGAQW